MQAFSSSLSPPTFLLPLRPQTVYYIEFISLDLQTGQGLYKLGREKTLVYHVGNRWLKYSDCVLHLFEL